MKRSGSWPFKRSAQDNVYQFKAGLHYVLGSWEWCLYGAEITQGFEALLIFRSALLCWFAAWGKTNEIQGASQTKVPVYFLTKTMLDHDHRQIQAVTGHHTIFHTRNWFAWTVRAKLRVCPKISRPTANRDFSFGACSMFKRFYTRSLLLRHAHILRCEVATLGLGVGRISEVSDIPQANSHKLSPAALMGSWLSRVITWVWNLVLIK